MAAGDATTISVLVRAKDEASAALNRIASNGEKMAAGFAKHRRAIGMAAAGMGTALTFFLLRARVVILKIKQLILNDIFNFLTIFSKIFLKI